MSLKIYKKKNAMNPRYGILYIHQLEDLFFLRIENTLYLKI